LGSVDGAEGPGKGPEQGLVGVQKEQEGRGMRRMMFVTGMMECVDVWVEE
jgi:hypothetical protein